MPNTLNVSKTTTTTTIKHDDKALYQGMDIAYQLEAMVEKNYRSSIGIFKAIRRNRAKKVKARQETQVTTQASKNIEKIIK